MSEAIEHVVPFPLPPTSGPAVSEPPISAPVAAAPAPAAVPLNPLDDLRAKVAEQAGVIELAKTRVETLGAEKHAALQQVNELKTQLAAAQQRIAALESAAPPPTVADLAARVAALEALVAPPRVA